jgi:hypothetical protein
MDVVLRESLALPGGQLVTYRLGCWIQRMGRNRQECLAAADALVEVIKTLEPLLDVKEGREALIEVS